MSLSVGLLFLLSGVCLLLWGLRTIKRAVLRGYGTQVQTLIAKGTTNRVTAFISGAFVTLFMQSSVATTVLTSSLYARGLMALPMGFAIIIGADVGSAVLAQILSFDMSWVAPLFLSVGIILHLTYDDGDRKRFPARIIMGLGFVLTGLAVIREVTTPLASSALLSDILSSINGEPVIAVIIGIALTFVLHSGLSAVLIFASLAHGGVLPLDLAIDFIVGANIGIALLPMAAVRQDSPEAVKIPIGNIIMRCSVGIMVIIGTPFFIGYINTIDITLSQKVVFAHIGFNILIALIYMPTLSALSNISTRLSPKSLIEDTQKHKPRYLDKKALRTPSTALSCATRETLHMSEILETMLIESYDAIAKGDEASIKSIQQTDTIIDTLYMATKSYIIALTREELKDSESERAMQIINFAMNLEHCGDIISTSLMQLVREKQDSKDQFSEEGLIEIQSIHKKVVKNLKLAQSLFLSSDQDLAKQLIDYKKRMKLAENESAANHIKRLQQALPQTMATSGIHMDVIRDYRRINTYITSIAYSVLKG